MLLNELISKCSCDLGSEGYLFLSDTCGQLIIE